MSSIAKPEPENLNPQLNNPQIDKKNNDVSTNKQEHKKITSTDVCLKSFNRIGICLNNKSSTKIQEKLEKVCFIIMNSYEKENKNLGSGPLNDGILIGLNYHRLDYKIFYLYNPQSDDFLKYLGFFLQRTTESLTVFYSGPDSLTSGTHDIEFINGRLSSKVVGDVIYKNANDNSKVVFITDSKNGGSVFDIHSFNSFFSRKTANIVSFSVKKEGNTIKHDQIKQSHGIFTYYFCKIVSDCPTVSPSVLVERINSSILKFNEFLKFETTDAKLADCPVFHI